MQRMAVLPLLLIPGLACAAQVWGDAQLGVLTTSGNSDTRSINGKIDLDYKQDRWHDGFVAQAVSAADQGETTSERYLVTDKLDFTFYQENYAFLSGEFEKDLFGGIRERTSETTGLGRHFLTGPTHLLDIELGGGARQQTQQQSRDKDDDLIGRFGLDYQYKISPTSGFRQRIKVETGQANTFTESVSELKLSILGNLSAALSYTVQNNTKTESSVKSTDTTTAINLSYMFGDKPK